MLSHKKIQILPYTQQIRKKNLSQQGS